MKKIRAFFDSRAAWTMFGAVFGTVFGPDVANAVGAVGVVVMAVL